MCWWCPDCALVRESPRSNTCDLQWEHWTAGKQHRLKCIPW